MRGYQNGLAEQEIARYQRELSQKDEQLRIMQTHINQLRSSLDTLKSTAESEQMSPDAQGVVSHTSSE